MLRFVATHNPHTLREIAGGVQNMHCKGENANCGVIRLLYTYLLSYGGGGERLSNWKFDRKVRCTCVGYYRNCKTGIDQTLFIEIVE